MSFNFIGQFSIIATFCGVTRMVFSGNKANHTNGELDVVFMSLVSSLNQLLLHTSAAAVVFVVGCP
jgi:hypothetical protein